ncbi:Polynucleotidyl transferase- ribonuclease H-like superfamily protein [Striga hermonthica]|uniref:Polynucleotidyl transferase- ribonuclease H-like superfamily protein n=1 Tax=Striga hermonthica TaxID=68872 RepID=A0A9N7R9U7_STRHE|nr:Polynucleotidyl transferase- ribonuclease H-like superfamily protein [Striga hermonthica]
MDTIDQGDLLRRGSRDVISRRNLQNGIRPVGLPESPWPRPPHRSSEVGTRRTSSAHSVNQPQLVTVTPQPFQMKYLKPMKLYHEVLKSNELKRSRLLGLDVGDKYVGLSVSDADNKIASPLSVLYRKKMNIDLIASDFQSLISKLSLSGLVIGYPFDRQRSSPDAIQVKLFIDDLTKTGKFGDLKYTFWDECFTSKNVEFLLKPLSLRPVQFKTIIDKFAAVGILQGYLDFVNRSRDQEAEIFQNEKYSEPLNEEWHNPEN